MEVELKLLIAPDDASRLRRFTLPEGWLHGAPTRKNLLSLYFDTPDFSLRRQGIALRVRRDGRRWIQTVKGGGSVQAGLHSRFELETPVAHDHPDFTKIDDPALNVLFAALEVRDRLETAFVTEFRRTVWLLESPDGDQVEMALDQGEIRAGDASTPISEVELELKSGNPAALYEAALALTGRVSLHLENASKAERGYGLRTPPAPPQPVKAAALDLRGRLSAEQAFQRIAWSCISHLQCNHHGLLTGDDVEYVHQMRVAMRRLRSACGLFARIAPAIRDAALTAEIRWFAAELGAARDWDVFVTETLPPILTSAADDQPLARLGEQALAVAAANRRRARQAADSLRYQQLLLRLGAWLNRAAWRAPAEKGQLKMLDGPILKTSARLLAKRHRQLRERGKDLAALGAAERHALRIAAKKLRYAAEFLSHLYPGAQTQAYLKALAGLQDILGVLNDHVVTRRLLGELEQGKGRANALQARAIGEIMGWNACQASLHLAVLDTVWEGFKNQKPFWKQ